MLLANALIDQRKPVALAIPLSLRLQDETSSYVVQSRERVGEGFRTLLTEAGATIVSYIPNNAFLVRIRPERASLLTASPEVKSVIPWQPYFKLSSELLGYVLESRAVPSDAMVRLLVYPGESEALVSEIQQLGLQVRAQSRSPFGTQVILPVTDLEILQLAHLDRVQWIETAGKAALLNDLTSVRLGTSTNNGPDTQYLGLTGKGVTVNINDTGVDSTHPDLSVHPDSLATVDVDGHGTHVAGIIASSGKNGPTPGANGPPGSSTNAHFHGKAPEAKILAFPFDLYLGSLIPEELTRQSLYTNGVFISNNSWGYPSINYYDSAAASYDEAVRDTLPGTPGFQPITFVFAAGNSGNGASNGKGGNEGTVTSPATAKNVISVGALESLRLITNGPISTNALGEPTTNRFFYSDTDSQDEVADFSSRGNVGIGVEGAFGRFKPDVVAPGGYIISTRSSDWTNTEFVINIDPDVLSGQIIPAKGTNFYRLFSPPETARVGIRLVPNQSSPKPFPSLRIAGNDQQFPPPNKYLGTNYLRVDSIGLTNLYFAIVNPLEQEANFDLVYYVGITNRNLKPGFFESLKEINDPLKPYYRYESGTSMAAPAISGMLALIQEFFTNRLARAVPSPALFKALLINSTKTVSAEYDRAVNASLNDQGWGIPLLSRILPEAMDGNRTDPDKWPIRFFDQDPKRSLTTGDSLTWTMTIDTNSESYIKAFKSPLNVTLVWTDPPGNPAASIKLVNDLDLIVTNRTTGRIYWGNNILGGSTFNTVTDSSETNRLGDVVNNVENVFISGALGTVYDITVVGHRVSVDTQPDHPQGVAQDFALVIGLGNSQLTNVFKITPPLGIVSNYLADILVLTNDSLTIGQKVSANAPLASSTNGELRQWRFYTFTNDAPATKTNLLFTILPSGNMSTPRLAEPDIDLYVSDNPALLTLDPAVLSAAIAAGDFSNDRRNGSSRTRGGTEFVTWDNSPATSTYYIAVKSEDQKAGEYDILAVATEEPFETQNDDGSVTLNLVSNTPNGTPIPDGSNSNPGGLAVVRPAVFVGRTPKQRIVHSMNLFLDFQHENYGDLTALLTAPNKITATVFSHTFTNVAGRLAIQFDESGTNKATNVRFGEGPIKLDTLGGQSGRGLWQFRIFDDAITQTGKVYSAKLTLRPQDAKCESDNQPPQGCPFQACPGEPFLYFLNLPVDTTAVDICIESNNIPAAIYLVKGRNRPSENLWLHSEIIDPPGGCLIIDEFSSPPVEPGLYRLGIFTTSPTLCVSGILKIQIHRGFLTDRILTHVSTNVPIALINDAVSSSVLNVAEDRRIVDARVGIRLAHPRVSDLSVHLVSPQGTSWLLAENRGITNANGFGATFSLPTSASTADQVLTNFSWTIFADNEDLADGLLKFSRPPFRSPDLVPNPIRFGSDFDGTAPQPFIQNKVVEGWTVITNSVAVIHDRMIRGSHSNVVALSHGTLGVDLTLKNQRLYDLEFAYRRDTSSTTQDITFPVGPVTYLGYQPADHLRGTIAPAVATPKLRLNPGQQVQVSVSPDALIQVTGAGQFVSAMGDRLAAPFRGLTRYALVGQWSYSSSLLSTQTAWGAPFFVGTNVVLDVPAAPGDYFLWLAVNDPNYGDNALDFPVNVRWAHSQLDQLEFAIGGVTRRLIPSDDWQTFRTRVSGREEPLRMTLRNTWNTTALVDDVKVTESIAAAYYLSEEPLPINLKYDANNLAQPFEEKSSVKGEIARGDWRLEILDSRAGAIAGQAELLGWFTQFVYGPRQRPLALTNCVDYTFRLRRSQIRYFEVNVPFEARRITNIVTSFSGRPPDVAFNGNQLPDINDDQIPASFLLDVGIPGPTTVAPGSKYFIAVQTDGSTSPNNIGIRVDFELPMKTLVNGSPVTAFGRNYAGATNRFNLNAAFQNRTNILYPGTNVHYYKYTVDPSPTLHAVVFQLQSTNKDLQLIARRSLPEVAYLPTPTLFDYHSINYDLTNDAIILRSNSFPVPLTASPWLLGVYNAGTNTGNYTLSATRWTNNPPALFPLPTFAIDTNWNVITNQIGFSLAPGESLNTFYRFQSGPTNRALLFELLSLTGDVDLRVRRDDLPSPSLYDFSDLQLGTNTEHVAMATNLFLPSFGSPTNWYINLLNQDSLTVTGLLRVATATGTNILISGLPLELDPVGIAVGGGLIITWRAIPGQIYEVRTSTNPLGPFNTVVAIITATSSIAQWTDPSPPIPPTARFYRVVQVGP